MQKSRNVRAGIRIFIGTDITYGEAYLSVKKGAGKQGLHVIGSTGEGKTKAIQHQIRQDIIHGNGLCFLDIHGHAYEDMVRWCVKKE